MPLGARRWLPLGAAWLVVTVGLLATWGAALRPDAVQAMPRWFLRIVGLTGSVVYDEPALALRVQITRLILIATAVAGAILAVGERRRLAGAIRELINLESDPLNLAVFRIVLFWQIWLVTDLDLIARYAALPVGLQVPPETALPRMGPLAAWAVWPLHRVSLPAIVAGASLLKGAAVTAALGLFSRTSAAVASMLFLVVWGRLQWYGKVEHEHHLFWFALLLALSPCGDALSLDVLVKRFRASSGLAVPPGPSVRYGRPLALAMILMGVIYLFPGLWKACRSGLDWALSDSPKFLMQRQWVVYDWLPILRFDDYPLLYRAGSLAVMLFELSFLFLLLGRRTRWAAGAIGFGFHLATYLALNIPFASLRNCYVVFVDWRGLLRWVRRVAAVPGASPPDAEPAPAAPAGRGGGGLLVLATGTLLIGGNLWAGATRAMDGWPLACYPPFDGLTEPHYRTVRLVVTLRDGRERVVDPDDYRTVLNTRWNTILQRILSIGTEQERARRLGVLWEVIERSEPWAAGAGRVRFYSVRRPVDPRRAGEAPDAPVLLYEATFEPPGP